MSTLETQLDQGRQAARSGRMDVALQCFSDAAHGHPLAVVAWHNLALLSHKMGRSETAARALRHRLILSPGVGLAWRLASEMPAVGVSERDAHTRAICAPDAPHISLRLIAAAHHSEGRLRDALPLYRRALVLDPGDGETLANLAAALSDLGEGAVVEVHARRALALQPNDGRVRNILGWVRLRAGDWSALDDYGARWLEPESESRANLIPAPLWRGEPAGTLRLYGQFGIGDELVFASMITDAAARAGRVVVEADPRLTSLFARSFPSVEIVPRSTPIDPRMTETDGPGTAFQASTAYLPVVLRRGPGAFPTASGFLKPDPDRVAYWRARFSELGPGPFVGIAWRGGVARTGDRKSLTLEALAPQLREGLLRKGLLREGVLPNGSGPATLISLQYGEDADERARAEMAGAWVPHANPAPDIRDDIETLAAQICALDLVISISGFTAHMAGALGRPGLVILPPHPLWFWFDQGDRTPFYPSLRLVRMTDGRVPEDLPATIASMISETS
jgi:Flp pilus assembly protein TadD/alkylhydroperoxidase family enzyme